MGAYGVRRVAEVEDAATSLLVRGLAGAPPTPLLGRPADLEPASAARGVLARALREDPRVSGWVALDATGRAVALLVATLEVTDEDHPAYTYMPERYAQATLSSWTVAEAEHACALGELVSCLAVDARRSGIRRLLVQTRPHDWVTQSVWRGLGLRPLTVTAARRTEQAPTRIDGAVSVRTAGPDDHDALVALAMEEHEHHATHTDVGVRSGQPVAPTARVVEQWLAGGAHSRALVAEDARGATVGCLALHLVDLPATHPAAFSFPRRYGYIGLTSVTADARGRGVGSALVAGALGELSELGRTEVFLDYAESNDSSRRFWNRQGFAPHVVTLGGDVLG